MSVQFPRVVRVFPARSLALFNRERSVRYSAGLNAVKDSVRPTNAPVQRCILLEPGGVAKKREVQFGRPGNSTSWTRESM